MSYSSVNNYLGSIFTNMSSVTPFVKATFESQQKSRVLSSLNELSSISSYAKNIGSLYDEVKKSGTSDAAAGLRSSVSEFVRTRDSKSMGNLVNLGTALVKGKNQTGLNSFLSAANSVNQLGTSSLTSKFVNASSSIFKDTGSGGLRSFTEATTKIANFAEMGKDDKTTKAGAVKNLAQLFSQTIEDEKNKGTSTAGINAKLNEITDALKSKTGLSQLANYLEEKVSKNGAAASSESRSTVSGAAYQNYSSGTFSQLA